MRQLLPLTHSEEDEEKNMIRISATINVEKESQKATGSAKKGLCLKKSGPARLAIGKSFRRVFCVRPRRQKRLD